MNKEKIAIIGGGIAGLTAGYLLNQKHNITLFEKTGRLGGNAHTHVTKDGEALDMAVASYSKHVSRNFFKLLREIKVKTVLQPASALLSVHNMETNTGAYLTPLNLGALFTQRFGMFRKPVRVDLYNAYVGMFKAIDLLDKGELEGLSVEDTIKLVPELQSGNSETLMMAPLCLLSSMYYEEVLKGPAEYFIAKTKAFVSFGPTAQMLGLHFPKNLTRSYVDALSSHFSDKVVLNARISNIRREDDRVVLRMEDGHEAVYSKVVFACNADQALSLLEKPTEHEQKNLGAWRYKNGLMVVHKDSTSFPPKELCQSWTCLQSTRNDKPHFSISICAWRLCPAVSNKSDYFSTQHPNFPINDELIDYQKRFRTPIYDFESFATIKELPSLNGKCNSYYCGSHFGFGLHNDAVTSAIEVAKMLGIEW